MPQGWKEDASETVGARNSQCQEGGGAAGRGAERPGKAQPGQVAGTAEPAVLPSTPGSTRRGVAAVGCLLAADWYAARSAGLWLSSRSRANADCRPHYAALTWD